MTLPFMAYGEWIWAALLVLCFVMLALFEVAAAPSGRPSSDGGDRRLAVNFALGTFNIALGSALPVSTVAAAILGQAKGIGLAHQVALPWLLVLGLTLLARSLTIYWVHRLSHAVPLLWYFHRIHHGDRAVDVSTTLRNHPLELAVSVPASVATVLLLGAPADVVLVVDTLLFATALWQHADIAVPGEGTLGRLLVTPALHRAHHAPARAEHDRNFGDVLIIWDRLFGTLAPPAPRDRAVGLEEAVPGPERLLGLAMGRLPRR